MAKRTKKVKTTSKKKAEKIKRDKSEFLTAEQIITPEMFGEAVDPLFLAKSLEPELQEANKLKSISDDFEEFELKDILPKTAKAEATASIEVVESDHDPIKIYFREMGKISLLSQQDEIDLARQMERGKKIQLRALLKTRLAIKDIISLRDLAENEPERFLRFFDETEDFEDDAARKKVKDLRQTLDKFHRLSEKFNSLRPIAKNAFARGRLIIRMYQILEELHLSP
ncbi:MAG: sigma-70 factor domain-containing protein, partial [Candidatus Saccharicenans sp.]